MSQTPRIVALRCYPAKGCGAVELAAAQVLATGLEHDRRFMVVDGAGGFVSQRTDPVLATVRVVAVTPALRLDCEGLPSLVVEAVEGGTVREVEVWGDRVPALSCGAAAAAWFERLLGRPAELVVMPEPSPRPVDPRFAGPGHRVGFADGFPLLVLSAAAVTELNRHLGEPVGLDRFRPNLVVDGCPPHAEDGWRRIRVGAAVLELVKPCARCPVVAVDQTTGVAGREPLATLARTRRIGGKVLFGQNAVVLEPGPVRVGDPVEVLQAREPGGLRGEG